MLSLSIDDVKGFMAMFLKSDVFDTFDLHSLSVHTSAVFEVHKHPAQPIPAWAAVRPYAFEIIKGGKPPSYVKAVLARMDGDDVMFLNITFEDGKITITSGMSQKTFSMDKTKYHAWNDHIVDFLKANNISYINGF